MFFDVIILLINVFWDIRGSIKQPKKNSGDIRRNYMKKVHFSSIRWVRPKLR